MCIRDRICDASTAATFCPYCGNPTVVPGQFAGTLKPDFVIPFKLSREDAIREIQKHYRGKVFLPKIFSKENHLQEIQGVYVPFLSLIHIFWQQDHNGFTHQDPGFLDHVANKKADVVRMYLPPDARRWRPEYSSKDVYKRQTPASPLPQR